MNEYKKMLSGHYKCPICGKVQCVVYGSGKKSKHTLNSRIRNKLNKEEDNEDN